MRRLLALLPLLLFLSARPAHAQLANAQGWCESGATVVISSGLQSTNQVQGSFPSCTISVSIHGGGTATIFSTGSSVPLSNPFTAQSNGRWIFYAANGEYDITMTDGGLTSPVTYSDVFITNVISSGGGGGTPCITTANSIQYNNAGAFGCAAGITTPDGKSIVIKGSDPWADIMAFGARANVISLLDGSTTGTITGGTSSLSVASASGWIVGDGITIQGAGATCTLSTPAAPTVTPSFLAGEAQTHDVVTDTTAGASTYQYLVIARDKFGCLTPPSSATTITTGESSLGLQTVSPTAVSLSNDTLTVTATTHLVSHTLVDLLGIIGYPWLGWSRVATNPGTTLTFTAYPIDSRAMPSNLKDITTGVSVGGTFAYYTLNYVSWTAISNAWEYYVCAERPGDVSFHVIGVTRPSDGGYKDISFEDLGATYLGSQTFPYYVTDSICTGSGQNDPLTTTVTNIAGTTFTLANAATNNASSTTVVHDSAPNILAALNSVSGSVSPNLAGYIYVPPGANTNESYPINSFLQLPSKVNIALAGNLLFGETMETNTNVIDGRYANLGIGQFATCSGAQLVSPAVHGANPSIYLAGSANVLRNLSISTHANAGLNAVSYGGNLTMDCTSWSTLGTSSDYAGINLILETNGALSNDFFSNTLFTTGPDQVTDKSWTPSVFATTNNQTGGPAITLGQINWNRRGMALTTGNTLDVDWSYRQGGISPMFAIQESQITDHLTIKNGFQDTEGQPLITNWSAGTPPSQLGYAILRNVSGGTTNLLVQGNRMSDVEIETYNNTLNNDGGEPNRNYHEQGAYTTRVIYSPYASGGGTAPTAITVQRFASPVVVQGGYSMGAALNPPTSITCANAAGGSIPNGTYVYTLASIDVRGGASMVQPQISTSCTTTTGNNTNNLTWVAALGAVTYNVYRAPVSASCISGYTADGCGFLLVASGVTGTSYSDTSATTTNNAPQITAGFITGMDNTGGWGPLWAFPETTAPSCTTGFDQLFGIISGHRLSFCNNGGSVDQVVGAATTDTLTNKTLINPVINTTIINTGTLTLPTTTDTLVGRATTDTLTNKTISAGTFTGAGSGGGSILLTGQRDGLVPVNATTTTPCTFGTSGAGCFDKAYVTGYAFNQHATAAQAITYNLPTAVAGKQFCAANSNNGSAANIGVITVATSASGQFIIFTDGTLSASGGNVTSGGAAGDAACFVGIDTTHWQQFTQSGTWTKH